MEKHQDQEVQETPTEVTISAQELEDLKKRADVSSQNFERLKKAEEEKKDLEARLKETENLSDPEYGDSQELRKEIDALNKKIESTTSSLEKDKVYSTFPVLKDHEEAFTTFSEDPLNAGMPLATRAKAFLVENDLLKDSPKRKGLEKQTGSKVTKSSNTGKITAEDAKRLRTTNPRKYLAMIEAGTLVIED